MAWQPCDQLATGWDYWAIKKLGLGFSFALRGERNGKRSTSFFCWQSRAWGSELWVGSSDWEFFRNWMKMTYISPIHNGPHSRIGVARNNRNTSRLSCIPRNTTSVRAGYGRRWNINFAPASPPSQASVLSLSFSSLRNTFLQWKLGRLLNKPN